MCGSVISLSAKDAIAFLLPKHYSGRVPAISYGFGWRIEGELVAVCTFGKPASYTLCNGVCGREFSSRVFELNRLCRIDALDKQLSAFVSACLRRLSTNNLIIVSYSDTAMNHHGYIYQACNFIYTGTTLRRTDPYAGDLAHHRHIDCAPTRARKIRSSKHRYIFFAMRDKRIKRRAKKELRYALQAYPKGDNSNYQLGTYLKPELLSTEVKP